MRSQNNSEPAAGLYNLIFSQNIYINVNYWNNDSGMIDIDWVRFGGIVQFSADFEQSGHIRDMLLGPVMGLIGFSKADMCFQHFCFDSLDSVKVQWLFSLMISEVLKVVAFHFLSAGINKLRCSENKQKESLLSITL